MHGNRRTQRQNTAAEVKRIPCVRIGPRDRKHFLLVQISRRVAANQKPEQPDSPSGKNPKRRRSRQPQNQNRQNISDPNPPSREKIYPRHAGAPSLFRTASKTSSTDTASNKASVSLIRLWEVTAPDLRKTISCGGYGPFRAGSVGP